MVFRGRPSKACHSCRERRIKCDLARPNCAQCYRAERECPGYRPHSDNRFLDQTAEVMTKARLAEIAWTEHTQSNQTLTLNLPRSLPQPVEARATSFFLSTYIQGSNFGYLSSHYTPYSGRDDHLYASIEAVGLASLSNELKSLDIAEEARKRYVYAIRATNKALGSPVRATKDSSLLSVLLLGLYEGITCTTLPALCSWENHIKGAVALILLRGHRQMNTQLGLQLLSQATSSVAVSAHRTIAEVPTEIISLVTQGLQYANTDDPTWNFRLLSFHSANFRAAVNAGKLSDPDAIIAAAMKLDHDFVLWSRTLPPSWQFETVFAEQADPSLVYEGYYHLYRTHGKAQSMNAWRMSRMQLNQMIREQILLQHPSSLHSKDYATLMHHAEYTITSLSSEICATIPQYVGLPPRLPTFVSRTQPPPYITGEASVYTAESCDSGFTHPARSYGIIWPMMVVATCAIPHNPRRTWVINRLRYIDRYMNNPQVVLALEILEGDRDIEKKCVDDFDTFYVASS